MVYSVNGTIDNSNCVQNQNNRENQAVKPEIIIGEGGYGSGLRLTDTGSYPRQKNDSDPDQNLAQRFLTNPVPHQNSRIRNSN